jgi:hypothetical protein
VRKLQKKKKKNFNCHVSFKIGRAGRKGTLPTRTLLHVVLRHCLAECSRTGTSSPKLCVELKFSGRRYVLGPTGFLRHVRRFASASYRGHLSGPKWLTLKPCPHVRTRCTGGEREGEREREELCLCV